MRDNRIAMLYAYYQIKAQSDSKPNARKDDIIDYAIERGIYDGEKDVIASIKAHIDDFFADMDADGFKNNKNFGNCFNTYKPDVELPEDDEDDDEDEAEEEQDEQEADMDIEQETPATPATSMDAQVNYGMGLLEQAVIKLISETQAQRAGCMVIVSYRGIGRLAKMMQIMSIEEAIRTCLVKGLDKDSVRMIASELPSSQYKNALEKIAREG